MTDKITAAAKAAGGTTYTNRHHDGTACAFGPEALKAFWDAAHRQGMERAAEICEAEQDRSEEARADARFRAALKDGDERNAVDRGTHWMAVHTTNAVLRNAAKAIRAEAHAQNQTEGN